MEFPWGTERPVHVIPCSSQPQTFTLWGHSAIRNRKASGPCGNTRGLLQRHEPRGMPEPFESKCVLLDQVRYTIDRIRWRFTHGLHRGRQRQCIVDQLVQGGLPPEDTTMAPDVGWYHGYHRSLNNRHLQERREATDKPCASSRERIARATQSTWAPKQ